MDRLDLLDSQSTKQQELDRLLDDTADEKLWEKHIFKYLDDLIVSKMTYTLPTNEFDKAGVGWLNCDALNFDTHLRDRVSLLDFFTYCCVNCMHIFPHLHDLEEKLGGEDFVVIGVHSAKFENEKLDENVKSAILRHGINHPVLNDPEMTLWNLCQIICWPTLLLLGPRGEILYKFIGEKNMDRLVSYVKLFVTYFKNKNELRNKTCLPLKPLREASVRNRFCSPSKVAVDEKTRVWAVADSANNRVLIFGKYPGTSAIDVIGKGTPALVDGSYETCHFSQPQGLCFFDGGLFVADTGNHAIRKVDFVKKTVTTIVGTGKQGKDLTGGNVDGPCQEISTPWDVALYKQNLLLIAMAGSHQIWAYAVKEDSPLFNGKVMVKRHHCICIAGSGREENRNTSYPLKAGFAQPSGLCLDGEEKFLYIADSESSSVRVMDMQSGAVKNVCGGALDPLDLFGFGDADGRALDVKLQHPLAVVWNPLSDRLIVADSYNHTLKVVDPKQRVCSTIPEVRDLKEPGGLAFDAEGKMLYIADTENHRVRILSMSEYRDALTVGPVFHILDKSLSQDATDSENPAVRQLDYAEYEDGIKVPKTFTFRAEPIFKNDCSLTAGAPQTCRLRGKQLNLRWNHPSSVNVPADTENELQLECQFVICSEADKTCKIHKATRSLKFERVEQGGSRAVEASILVE